MADTVILAYSGGLDTSVLVKVLQQSYGLNVITVTVDVGQQEDLGEIGQKAKDLGVLKHYSVDGKKEFVTDYIFPSIRANALYEEKYPISTALARPLIVQKMVDIARKEGASAVAHGCTGKGNDQVRFDVTTKALAPDLTIIAPVRERNMARDEEIKFAKANNIRVPVNIDSPYSIDQNLWGRAIECGAIDHPEKEPPEEAFEWTVPPEKAPDNPEYLTVKFAYGVPCALNGEEVDPVTLIEAVNRIAGSHGIGRIDHIEDRLVGIKSREVYECPAAMVLLEAHKDLEKMVLTRHENLFKPQIDAHWTFLLYAGLWMDPLRESLEEFINKTQERVEGEVRMKLYKGGCRVVGRSSPMSLYSLDLATYDVQTTFNQSWSQGFIEIWGMQSTTASALRTKVKKNKKPMKPPEREEDHVLAS
jgi:argininosuccinate synthase